MGLQEMMLLVMILFSFCSLTSFAPLSKNLDPDQWRTFSSFSKQAALTNFGGVDNGFENTHENMVNQMKYTTAPREGGGGGQSEDGSNENGGQANSSPQGGGNGVVPVYAAGAASQRRNHKGGAATYAPSLKGRFAVLIVTSASLLLYK